ncbi:MAG: TonB-dependent receptor [Flavobacterium sp.]
MNKSFLLTILILFIPITLFSQIKITGKIINQQEKNLELREVLLLNKDSIAVISELTDANGLFSLSVEKGDYTLMIREMGTITYQQRINAFQDLNLGVIKITETTHQLGEVMIASKKELIERKIDRVVFNVENSISASGGDALDALKVTPGLRVQNDQIVMIGKSSMAVMIDDRLMQLSGDDLINFLKTIPSENITKIEVITTPPAKYDAAGNTGLINIKLKKVKKDSWNGTIGTSYTQRAYASESSLGSFNYNKNNLSIQASANGGSSRTVNTDNNKTYYPNEIWEVNNPRKIKDNYLSIRTGIDYQITPKLTSGIQYLGSYSKMKMGDNSLTTLFDNNTQGVNSYIKSDGQSVSKPNLNSINWHTIYSLDTIGTKISMDLDMFKYRATDSRNYYGNHLNNDFTITPNTYFAAISSNENYISNYSGKIDFEMPRKWAAFSFGGKLSQSKTDNSVAFFDNTSGNPILDPMQTNKFKYTENNEALYFSGNKEINPKWSTQLGLRMEATQTKGFSENYNQTNLNDYIQLFPTAYLSYKPKEHHSLSLNYSRRINRPNYEQLNPFRIYNSPYLYVEGNPFLKPSFSDRVEFAYTYKNLESKLSFSKSKDEFQQLGIVDPNTNITRFLVLNFMNTSGYGITETYTYNAFKWWTSTNSFDFGYTITKSTSEVTQKNRNGYQTNFSTANDFTLNTDKTFLLNFNYWYSLPGTMQLFEYTSSSSLSIALKCLLLNKKLQFSVTANDIFKTERPVYTNFSNGIKQVFNNYYDNQMIRFSVRYKFGNAKLNVTKRDFGNSEEQSRVNK